MASSSFNRIVKSERFLRALARAKGDAKQMKRIIKHAKSSHLLALAEILKNLKLVPLTPRETLQYSERCEAIKRLIKRNTKFTVRKSICLKKNLQSGKGQIGGIFPLLPIIASIGASLISSLLNKKKE
jgi:hypothetical protein